MQHFRLSRRDSVAFLSLLLSIGGCGDDVPPRAPESDMQRVDQGPVDLGTGDDGGADGSMPMACSDPGGPTVTVLAPDPASDPVADDIVVGPFGEVRCQVGRGAGAGSEPIDPESVTIEVLDEGGSLLASPAVTADGDVYIAQPNLSAVPNGPVVFRCSATDTAEEPRCNSGEVTTFVDNGPSIEVISPADGSIHAQRMLLRYRIDEAPLTDGDTEAAVAGHTLVVGGATVTPTVEGDELVADIDFSDRSVYPEALSGDYELTIEATNGRTPDAATARHTQAFVVDTDGPTIVIDRPADGELVGGTVVVEATITDMAGVDPSTVVLRAAGLDFPMTRAVGTDEYRASFDASSFPTTVVELTLNITAEDVVANSSTVGLSVKLDAVPPLLDLDPPDVREAKLVSGEMQCSTLFDPVGADSVNDGQIRGTTPELRVRAWDVSNSSFGGAGTVIVYAGIDSVEVLVLDDSTQPLLVDSNSDGVCDAVSPAAEPDPADPDSAVRIEMAPISPRGNGYYNDPNPTVTGTPTEAYGAVFDACVDGESSTIPSPLCSVTSPLTVAIDRPDSGDAAIYGKTPVTTDTCLGDSWDFVGAGIDEGWACVVARGRDSLGNVGVSPPLRVCLSDGVGADPCGGAVLDVLPEGMRPSCTDGCTLPPTFDDFPGLQRIGPAP